MKLDETSATEFFAQYGSDQLLVNHNGRVYDLKVWLSQAKFDTTISKALLAIKKKMSDLVKKGKITAGLTIEEFIRKNFSLNTSVPDVFVRDGTTPYGGTGSGFATFDNKELGKTLVERNEKMYDKIKEGGPNSYEPLSTIKFWPKGAGLYEVYINGVNVGLFDEDDYEKLHSLEATFLNRFKKLLEPTMSSRRSISKSNLSEHCGGANFDTSCSSKLGRCHTNYSSRRQSHVSSSQPPSGRYRNKVDLRFPRRIDGIVYHSEDELRFRLFELLEAVNSLDYNVEKYSTQMLLDLAYSKKLIDEEVKLNEAIMPSKKIIRFCLVSEGTFHKDDPENEGCGWSLLPTNYVSYKELEDLGIDISDLNEGDYSDVDPEKVTELNDLVGNGEIGKPGEKVSIYFDKYDNPHAVMRIGSRREIKNNIVFFRA